MKDPWFRRRSIFYYVPIDWRGWLALLIFGVSGLALGAINVEFMVPLMLLCCAVIHLKSAPI